MSKSKAASKTAATKIDTTSPTTVNGGTGRDDATLASANRRTVAIDLSCFMEPDIKSKTENELEELLKT
jgi:hypothetical protein